ncbi:MAG: site-specific integrase, partial [Boseongicola sp.]|nr:site-specific integrase [Boseongicola sp.]
PVAADRSAPILSVIMRQAEVYGYRREGSNPCIGIRRYRRRGRERFLSMQEIGRLKVVLDRCEEDRSGEVAFIRLLLLTGCRRDEIRTLRWPDYREGHLFLRDAKTGPRTVWLSLPARKILGRLPRKRQWVFPSPRTSGPISSTALDDFWRLVREEAGIADVRLHDLRHTYASIAIMQGESITTTGRLLGHSNPETTLKYAHLSDDSVRQAANDLGAVLGRA